MRQPTARPGMRRVSPSASPQGSGGGGGWESGLPPRLLFFAPGGGDPPPLPPLCPSQRESAEKRSVTMTRRHHPFGSSASPKFPRGTAHLGPPTQQMPPYDADFPQWSSALTGEVRVFFSSFLSFSFFALENGGTFYDPCSLSSSKVIKKIKKIPTSRFPALQHHHHRRRRRQQKQWSVRRRNKADKESCLRPKYLLVRSTYSSSLSLFFPVV